MSTKESEKNSLDEIQEEVREEEKQVAENGKKEEEASEDVSGQEDREEVETPEAQAEGEEHHDMEALKKELEASKKEALGYKDQLIRLQAEFSNFRKRKEKEVVDMVRFANEDLIKTLLPILDNFDRTLDAIEKTDNLAAIKDGIQLVDTSMRHQLQKIGLEPIECKDKPFDPSFHDAISSLEVEDEEKKGLILDEVEKGYVLRDKVIRFSKVIVAE